MAEIGWEKDAEAALGKAPFFLRGMIRGKVSKMVAEAGGSVVTLSDFKRAEEKFRAMMGGKSEKEISSMLPADNEPGVEMIVVNACQSELSNCPNVLISTSEWKAAVDKWIEESGANERLRELVKEDKVLFHHKLKVSIAGCPNGCSRPQIADIGIVGFVRPDVDSETCTTCGACEVVCPDAAISVDGAPPVFDRMKCQGCLQCRNICPHGAITLSKPRVKLLLGGKLGRHPHLAEPAGEAKTPEELAEKLEKLTAGYIAGSKPGERFANYWMRTRPMA